MEQNGFTVKVENVNDLTAVKARYQVPVELQACHTAIVDGYVIEGHVPVADIERLMTEKPDIVGLSVPGMPPGSPGMEVEGYDSASFNVISFDKAGEMEVFAVYGQ